jgi:very-short-patch-repair endonuclease
MELQPLIEQFNALLGRLDGAYRQMEAFNVDGAHELNTPRRRRALGDIRARKLLTDREQPMFHRLQQAFPEYFVLTQVAFSALITAKDMPTRATFNRKVADFVLTNKAFEVVAVIELDDASHRGREEHDSRRDSLLERAGYRVLRFKKVPDVDAVQRVVSPPISIDSQQTSPS